MRGCLCGCHRCRHPARRRRTVQAGTGCARSGDTAGGADLPARGKIPSGASDVRRTGKPRGGAGTCGAGRSDDAPGSAAGRLYSAVRTRCPKNVALRNRFFKLVTNQKRKFVIMDKCTSVILGNKRLEKCADFWYDYIITEGGRRCTKPLHFKSGKTYFRRNCENGKFITSTYL